MEKQYTHQTHGVCSSQIDLVVDGDTIQSVAFTGGCHGNAQGIGRLVAGEKIDVIISKLRGIRCGNKSTSCPAQLAEALQHIKDTAE